MVRKQENSREGRELQGETLKEQNIVRKQEEKMKLFAENKML